jgi:hypothetical protein
LLERFLQVSWPVLVELLPYVLEKWVGLVQPSNELGSDEEIKDPSLPVERVCQGWEGFDYVGLGLGEEMLAEGHMM